MMAKKTYKKRNYRKSLPKVGGTVAMTMALAAALAVPAQATEVEGAPVSQDPGTPVLVDTPVTDIPAAASVPAPEAEPSAPAAEAPAETPASDSVVLELPPPPEFEGEYVEDPGDRPNRPGDYEGKAPEAPTPTHRLETVEKLDKLYDKVIVTWTPEDPTPSDIPETPSPWALPTFYYEAAEETDGPVIILDEAVPLAAAPRTGDISGIWAAISAASLAGMAWLGIKRKEER